MAMIKLPYGISDFEQIIKEDYFYIDRTDRILNIETIGKQLLFLRPRRFGKSMLLSMLENYYDVAKTDKFEQLFGHLSIGQNPTSLHNKYLVLRWDFSNVSPLGDAAQIERALHDHLNVCMRGFSTIYQDILSAPIDIVQNNALATFRDLLTAVKQTPYPLYLFIDEYDNFANEVMMGDITNGPERYQELMYGESFFRTLFKSIKSGASGWGLERVFITGVSPVVLSDLTSGYNVSENITLSSEFADLCGFSESEIETVLNKIVSSCDYPSGKAEEALSVMRTFYNGYSFRYGGGTLVYNPTLALYFMKHFQRGCAYPRAILDHNLEMDRGKIAYIADLTGGEDVIWQTLDEKRPLAITELSQKFGIKDMLAETKDRAFMVSLLYYFGVLTMDNYTPMGELTFRIPNLVVRRLYVEQIHKHLLPTAADQNDGRDIARVLYQHGNLQPVCTFVEDRYFKIFDNRDYRWANELTLKTAFLTLLFNDTFYIMDSETALQRSYADLVMIIRPEMRKFALLDILLEFKYISLKKLGLSGKKIGSMSRTELEALPVVKENFADAEVQARKYGRILQKIHSKKLRLRIYTIVSLGFERLLWHEMR